MISLIKTLTNVVDVESRMTDFFAGLAECAEEGLTSAQAEQDLAMRLLVCRLVNDMTKAFNLRELQEADVMSKAIAEIRTVAVARAFRQGAN